MGNPGRWLDPAVIWGMSGKWEIPDQMPLSQSTIDIVKKTAPAVASNGEAIIDTFYRDLLTNPDNAEIMKKFPHSHHIPQAESKELDPLILQKRRTAGRAVHKESGRQQHAAI